jgi:hypothetical protein
LAQLPFEQWISESYPAGDDESTAIYLEPKPTATVHKAKAESVKSIAKVTTKQSVKALLTAKKSDKNDKKSVSVASKSKDNVKGKSITVPTNHIVAMAQKMSANNKALAEKNKVVTKGQKPVAKTPMTVAAVTKNTSQNKKSKHG